MVKVFIIYIIIGFIVAALLYNKLGLDYILPQIDGQYIFAIIAICWPLFCLLLFVNDDDLKNMW